MPLINHDGLEEKLDSPPERGLIARVRVRIASSSAANTMHDASFILLTQPRGDWRALAFIGRKLTEEYILKPLKRGVSSEGNLRSLRRTFGYASLVTIAMSAKLGAYNVQAYLRQVMDKILGH